MKQNRLRPIFKKKKKKRTINVQMFRAVGSMFTCPVCNHIIFPVTRSTSPHEWIIYYEFKWQPYCIHVLCCSHIQPSLLGKDGRLATSCHFLLLTKVSLLTMITSFAPAFFAIKPFVNNVQFPLCIATASPCISVGFSGCLHRPEGLACTKEYLGW